jgi:SHAQKYF class myb-like DNA-binding protein
MATVAVSQVGVYIIQGCTCHQGNDILRNSSFTAGRWTQEEHNMFLQGLQTHQKQWKLIADMVKTRTVVQIRTHAQKYFQKLHKTTGWNKFDKMDDPNSPISVRALHCS